MLVILRVSVKVRIEFFLSLRVQGTYKHKESLKRIGFFLSLRVQGTHKHKEIVKVRILFFSKPQGSRHAQAQRECERV